MESSEYYIRGWVGGREGQQALKGLGPSRCGGGAGAGEWVASGEVG